MHRRRFHPAAAVATLATAAVLALGVMSTTAAQAQGADPVKADFARAVYLHSATQVHDEAPQALLRAVVVLRVKLGDDGRWSAEVFRDNPEQPEMTRRALDSVQRLPAPVGLSDSEREALRTQGLIEAWLFQSDGRFVLKTLARPQKRA